MAVIEFPCSGPQIVAPVLHHLAGAALCQVAIREEGGRQKL